MIIQGQNDPIVVNLSEAIIPTKLHALLYTRDGKDLKHWELADVTIDGSTVYLPLTEAESVKFPACKASLEMKWIEGGIIDFIGVQVVDIEARKDNDLLGEV